MRGSADNLQPVLRLVLDRARAGSRPGARTDEHVVCLAIEGGGLRGAVSAGMCLVLEAEGLGASFDRIYGVSAGAFNGACLASGQVAHAPGVYRDAASPRCINPWRALARRAVIDFDFLFDELIGARGLLTAAEQRGAPEFRALATSRETLSLRVLRDFADGAELAQAVRASAALPGLCGTPAAFRGEAMIDGALVEAIPYRTPLRERATHVLVLRSRPAEYRVPRHWASMQRAALHRQRDLAALAGRQPEVYNRDAARLQHATGQTVLQIAVTDRTPLIGRLEADRRRVDEAVAAGATAMSAAIALEPRHAPRSRPAPAGPRTSRPAPLWLTG